MQDTLICCTNNSEINEEPILKLAKTNMGVMIK